MHRTRTITLTYEELAILSSFLKDKARELNELEETAGHHEALTRLQRTNKAIYNKVFEAINDVAAEIMQTEITPAKLTPKADTRHLGQ